MRNRFAVCFAAALALCPVAAKAQSVGGNASIAATSTSANTELPQPTNGAYPALLLEYALGATEEIFYNLGSSDLVTAVAPSLPTTQGSPALPANGICVYPGPNRWLAAITATSTATIRATQLSTCPP